MTQLPDSLFDGPPQELINARPGPAPAPGHRRRATRIDAGPGNRLDIQGLRALAVLLVILDHVGSWPRGGFIGVDVFFVISGFLITGVLVRAANRDQHAGHYFLDFYLRRARRILPAAITVLIACWIAANLVFRGARVAQSHSDIWWALGFSANIHFAHIGTDYFEANRAPSLVQHYWSLSVEEQFYLVWPILIILVVALLGRRRPSATKALLPIVLLLTVVSFVWAVHVTSTSPTAAYFSPWVRAWELGVGAVLAVALASFPRMCDWLGAGRGPLALVGVAGIVLSAALIRSSPGFPAPTAAAPVLCTALTIFAGSGRASVSTSRWTWPLTNRAATYIGDISYSLYLWHWPTILVVGALVSQTNDAALYYLLIVVATLGLSVFTFHFVEEPLRFRSTEDREERNSADRRRIAGRAALAALVLLVATLALYMFKPLPAAPPVVAAPPPAPVHDSHHSPLEKLQHRFEVSIARSISATSWSNLNPSLDHIDQAGAPEWVKDNCVTVTDANERQCRYGGPQATKTAAVVGDSFAVSLMPGLRAALEPEGYRIQLLTRGQCPVAETPTALDGVADAGCQAHHAWVLQQLRQIHPDLLLLSDSYANLLHVTDAGGTPSSVTSGLAAFLAKAKPLAKHTVFVGPPPGGGNLQACVTATSTPTDCLAHVTSRSAGWVQLETPAIKAAHVPYIDIVPYFCYGGACPAVIGNTPVYTDGNHLTAAYSSALAPLWRIVLPR